MIPFSGNKRRYEKYRKNYLSAIQGVLDTGYVLQGGEVKQFEEALADYIGREYAVAVGSCTDALFFTLKALGVGPGDEVLVPDFSFLASATPILRVGARPVFVDVDDEGLMDLEDAERKVTLSTKAMIYVHLYGTVRTEFVEFGRRHDIFTIEDAAQAMGNGGGLYGDVSCMSFDPTKVIGALGSGGAVLTDDSVIESRIRSLRYHDKGGDYWNLGYNSQMSSISAGALIFELSMVDSWVRARQDIASEYMSELKSVNTFGNFHKFVIRVDERDRFIEHMSSVAEVKVHYPYTLCELPMFGWSSEFIPTSFALSRSVVSLPIHPFLEDDEIRTIVNRVGEWYSKGEV